MDSQPTGADPSTNSAENTLLPSPPNATIEETDLSCQSAEKGAAQQNPTAELKREFRSFEKASFAIQVVLAIIGIGALCIYNGQLNVMRGTLEEMRRSGADSTHQVWQAIGNINWLARTMEESTRETNRQSREALNASIKASRTDQRAWISVKNAFFTSPLSVGTHATFKIEVLNSGKTPTLEMSAFNTVFFTDDFKRMTIGMPIGDVNASDVGPNQTAFIYAESQWVFTQPIIDGIGKNRIGVYAWGEIEYRDIFHIRRVTAFCFSVTGSTLKSDGLANCPTHNAIQ